MPDNTGLDEYLRSELEATAQRVVPGRQEAPAGFLARVTRRQRRLVAVRRVTSVVVTLAVLLTAGFVVTRRHTEPDGRTVIVAGTDGSTGGGNGPVGTRDVTWGLGDEPVLGLSSLRRPSVTAVSGGFIVWGGLGGTDAGSSDTPEPPALRGSDEASYDGSGVGALYSTGSGTWTPLPPAPLSPRANHLAVWTGDELIIGGGTATLSRRGMMRDVAAYSPASRRWRSLEPLPGPRADATGVFVDGTIVIAGGTTPRDTHPNVVFLGNGSTPWSSVSVQHPVHGAVAAKAGAVVYGFDANGSRALRFTLIDARGGRTELPDISLGTDEIPEFSVGTDGSSVYAALDVSDTVTLSSLVVGQQEWTVRRTFTTPEHVLGTNAWTPNVTGELVVRDSTIWSVTPRGAYRLTDDGAPESVIDVTPQCAAATTFGLSRRSGLYWVDRSCDGRSRTFVLNL